MEWNNYQVDCKGCVDEIYAFGSYITNSIDCQDIDLVVVLKKKQDLRIDLPTVGLKTLKQCSMTGLKGIVLKNKQNIFLDKNKCINWANKNKMFITVK